MKTLFEQMREDAARREKERLDREAEDDRALASVKAREVPLFRPEDPFDLIYYEGLRGNLREMIRTHSHGGWVGLACDGCRTELFYRSGMASYTERSVGCIGWVGEMRIR